MRPPFALVLSLALVACAHDFGSFEPVPGSGEGGSATDATPDSFAPESAADAAVDGKSDVTPDASEDTHVADAPCTPSASCIDTATSCAGTCQAMETSCEADCGGGMSFKCKHECETTDMGCVDNCVTACTTCTETAGCAGETACQAAAH
jgi:hypothetical protein